jgi:hypothetical protein
MVQKLWYVKKNQSKVSHVKKIDCLCFLQNAEFSQPTLRFSYVRYPDRYKNVFSQRTIARPSIRVQTQQKQLAS